MAGDPNQQYYGGQPQQQYYGGQPVYYGQPMVVSGGAVGAQAQGYSQPQQQYAAPPPPPSQPAQHYGTQQPSVNVVPGNSGFVPGETVKHNPNERFAPNDGCRDAIWAVLFAIQVFIMFVLCIYYGTHTNCPDGMNPDGTPITCQNDFKLSGKLWGLIILLLIGAAVFSAIYLWIVRSYPAGVIKFTIFFCIGLGFLQAIILFGVGEVVGGVFMLLFAILQCVWYYFVRHRIPFSATILAISTETINKFPAMLYISYSFIVVQAVWLIVWLVAASSILNSMNNGNSSGGNQGIVVFFLLLSFYWTTQVLKNIVHVTCSGSFASWYFLYPQAMPQNPTVAALKRASWTSLGSIALGSLIIAVLQTMRAMIRMGRNNRNGFVRCCVLCVLKCLEDMIRFFNIYAFTHVAVYGSTYCEAAKQTWGLIKGRGWDLLVNDQLISPVLAFGAILVGLLCAVVSVLLAYVAWDLEYWGAWAFAGFLIGLAVSLCAMEVVESCIATLFVCFAEDPEALARTKPTEYNRLDSAFRGRMVEIQRDNRDNN